MTERPPEVVSTISPHPCRAPHIQEVFDSVGPMAADLAFVPDELKALAVEAEGTDDFGDGHSRWASACSAGP